MVLSEVGEWEGEHLLSCVVEGELVVSVERRNELVKTSNLWAPILARKWLRLVMTHQSRVTLHFLALRRLILGERASEVVRQGVRLGRRDECVEEGFNGFRVDVDPLFEFSLPAIVNSGALADVFLRVSNGRRLPRARGSGDVSHTCTAHRAAGGP